MATDPKIRPCPICKSLDGVGVVTYEYGCKHVECETCWRMGPGEGNRRQAIKSWNAAILEIAQMAEGSAE